MIKRAAFANAVTVMMMVAYLVCSVLSILAPSLIVGLAQSWLNSFNIEVTATVGPATFMSFITGFISSGVVTWVVSFLGATLYNSFAHGEVNVFRTYRGYSAS